jgi:tRNA 2-thiouridine synthesizing protein E
MITVRVTMKTNGEPVKRMPVAIVLDATGETLEGQTDRAGMARFALEPASGKVLVSGIPRHHGRLDGEIQVALWSLTESGTVDESGSPGGVGGGSTAYPGMQTRTVRVNGHEVLTDSEGYLVDMGDWSEDFVRAQAQIEGLELNSEHWQVVRFLRDYYEAHNVQAPVRDIIRHFGKVWGRAKGSNRYLHDLFPRGGPQKQGNRLAGLMRTKGEH